MGVFEILLEGPMSVVLLAGVIQRCRRVQVGRVEFWAQPRSAGRGSVLPASEMLTRSLYM
jgi:hypothetical protein